MTRYIAEWASGFRVCWRALSWSEYREFKQRSFTRPMGVLVDIYRAVLLEGPPPEACPAGIATFIAQHVLRENPFSGEYAPMRRAMEQGRGEVTSRALLAARAMVVHLLHYSFEEIDKWDPDTFFTRLAQAEFIAGKELPLEDPKVEKTEAEKQAKKRAPLTRAQSMVMERMRQRGKQ